MYRRALIIIIILLMIFFVMAGSGLSKPQDVLTPENANEARLNRLQPPDEVMDAIGIKQGMVVAEIGAGHGRYVVQIAVRVGENGSV
jgi:tRNA G46 methylase TrmB